MIIQRFRWTVLLAVLAAALALAGCGGKAPAKNSIGGSVTQQLSRCTPQDTTMACELAKQPPALISPFKPFAQGYFTRGVDFAWSCPNPNGVFGGATVSFAVSYLSPDASKNWSRGCIQWWLSAGKKVGTVYESSAGRAGASSDAGAADADLAGQQARYLGEPRGRTIFFAIDFDAGCSQTFSYFDGVNRVLGRYGYATGAYGGITPIRCLFNAGKIKFGWQAYAWSSGCNGGTCWEPRAQLEQWLNGDAWDYDRTIGGDPGLWPWQTGPTVAQYNSWRRARDSSLRGYRRQRCRQPVVTSAACQTLARRVNGFQLLVDGQGLGPRCFGHGANVHPGAPVCQIVRPAVAVWSRASASSYRHHNRAVGRYFDRRITYTLVHSRL